jgi:hypothetical protein
MNVHGSKLNQLFNKALDKGRFLRVLELGALIFFFSWLGWRLFPTPKDPIYWLWYAFAVTLIFLNAFYAGAKYVQDIYEIDRFRNAFNYLWIVFFGYNLPKVKVAGGKKNFPGKSYSLENIGGPGICQIERDNVVVVETLNDYKDVLMAGEWNLTRYDYIKDVLSTEEQYEKITGIDALTADGIRVEVKEVQIRFRMDGFFLPNGKGRQTVAYMPYKNAVKDLAYQQNVPVNGKLANWTTSVKGVVSGIVREHINNSYLADLISPREAEGHPLDKMRRDFESKKVKDRFKKMGVRFDSCNIGEIIVPAVDVDKEHLKMWFVRQSGIMSVIRAQSDSESFASQERGRAEGQAMLLRSISSALQEIGMGGKDSAAVRKNLRNILLTRTAQILESRTSIYKNKNYKENGEHDNKAKL